MPTAKKTKPAYSIVIDFGSEQQSGSGDTMLDALEAVRRPVKIVGKTFISISNGARKANLVYLPTKAKRLFYPNAQLYLAKQLDLLLR